MKINRKNPKHLYPIALTLLNSYLALAARPFVKRKNSPEKVVIFYGHTLNGNLKAFYDFLLDKKGYVPYFLSRNPHYYIHLKKAADHPETILNTENPKDMMKVAQADAIITSHGLHPLLMLRLFTGIKFVDVFHAVSYKGFNPKAFRGHHAHDETWVSSGKMRQLYISRYGLKPETVKVTGYVRTDKLINGKLNKQAILRKYSIPKAKKYILIAPTWQQDIKGRSILPFSVPEETFFGELDKLAHKHSAHIIFRTHLNSSEEIDVSHLSNTSFMPYSRYEVVEDFLFITDILVTDWSSTGIDYLPLQRPTIFLDVPAPFRHGFNLGPEHRYGDVVDSFADLKKSLGDIFGSTGQISETS